MKENIIDEFIACAQAESATTARVDAAGAVPRAVADYLRANELPAGVRVFGLDRPPDWNSAPDLQFLEGAMAPDGDTVVTGCYAGIAEAGALVLLSCAEHPAEVHFLAATHIAVIRSESIVPKFEAFWSRLRAEYGESMPRTMNFIVGPSRTADLGVPSRLGAHGPARVHIIVVDSDTV